MQEHARKKHEADADFKAYTFIPVPQTVQQECKKYNGERKLWVRTAPVLSSLPMKKLNQRASPQGTTLEAMVTGKSKTGKPWIEKGKDGGKPDGKG